MQGDDPPYLSVGTAVSAKYKGAFCEAKVSKVVRIVKCKVTYKMGLGTATVSDEHIKGTLRVGQSVQVKHPDKKDFVEATITKIQDCSQYTVVFDDGDITTLRRTALCLKSGRHFNESETLDQLPLTHPEHFGNPVMGGRGARGRRSRQLKEDSSEGEAEEENEPDLEMYSADIGRVVSVESSEKKRNKDNWFPGLIVMPSAQPTVKINVKDEFLVRSFKDGRYYTVPKKEVTEFTREIGRVESNVLAEAVEKALKYLDEDELPVHWEKNSLFNTQNQYSDSEENFTDSSDDEPREEKDHFVAQLYKFMDDSGTPLNKSPMIGNKDVDLYRLFRIVHKLGGYNRVTNQNKWKTVTLRLKFSNNQNVFNQVKMVYKKCLLSYESFYRTLGCTMSDHTRSSKKNRGRSLIRDRDRVTPVQSPKPEKDETPSEQLERKEEEEKGKVKKTEVKKTDDEKKRSLENSDNNSGENVDQVEPVAGTSKDIGGRPKRVDAIKGNKDKKTKVQSADKAKVGEKSEDIKKEEKDKEDDKIQQTRSKGLPIKPKEVIPSPDRKTREQKTPMREAVTKSVANKTTKKSTEEEKKRGRKRNNTEDKSNSDSASETPTTTIPVNIGDKLKVYYGPTHESRAVTYEAKVIEIDSEGQGPIYMVHYTGWNTRYDEWITPQRIAENLSATTKAKRLKQGTIISKGTSTTTATTTTTNTTTTATTTNTKQPTKRGRGISITGKSTSTEPPRSTTPSSITSSSSRTKSPATPATTRNSRLTRQGDRRTRRTSVQTDVSVQSDSDSEGSESESEQSRTRSGIKNEDGETKAIRKRLTKTKGEKRKDDDDTEKEEEVEKPKKTPRKLKKSLEPKPTDESDDDNVNLPKGRDFDLNQIRSELKGITKLKLHSAESSEKDTISSDDSTATTDIKPVSEENEEKKEKVAESTSSSEDIYEFKEPEPFEFETHKIADDKNKKRFVPRILDNMDKSPKKKSPKPIRKENRDNEDKKFKCSLSTVKKEEDDENEKEIKVEDTEDPFDKLVESPSFHIGKATTEKSDDYKKVTKIINLDSPLVLFRELPLTIDDETDERLDISDNEDPPNEPLFTHKEQLFTNVPFSKSSPSSNIDSDCVGFTMPKSDDRKPTTSDDEDLLETTMKNVLSFDNDSSDTLLINQPNITYETSKQGDLLSNTITLNRLESEDESKTSETFVESKDTQEKIAALSRQIAPVFQETDSTLLKDLYTSQFSKSDNIKDINVKTGTKIADSILQKFNMIKSKDSISPVKLEPITNKDENNIQTQHDINTEVKTENDEEKEIKEVLEKADEIKLKNPELKSKTPSPKEKMSEIKIKSSEKTKDLDLKKRPSRKFVSKEFIEESDTDSSDSDERLIMDEDSQTSMSLDMKPDIKESDSNTSFAKHEQSELEEPQTSFKFDTSSQNVDLNVKEDIKMDVESAKEEEPDSHSLLWCEETIPGSPAPATNEHEIKPKKNELEMPFASVPCSSTSNTKSLLNEIKTNSKERIIPPPLAINMDSQENRDASSAVLDNTPPTTPESTLSNLSPRGENGDLSPNTADNESCKSTEAETDYPHPRRGSAHKVSPYSEEDTLMNSECGSISKKGRDDLLPSPCKKRRRSSKIVDDVPAKRGRKPHNRSRHNSDSDDTSEHSVQGSTNISLINNIDTRLTRSPRPSKYNFFVEFDPSLDSTQRIAVLQQKLAELRKTYANVKAELAAIERRRKKIRRREREAKASKQEMTCT